MKGLDVLSSSETGAVLFEALDRKTPFVVSFRNAEGWSSIKSRILGVDAKNKCLTIERPSDRSGKLATGILPGQYLGAAFRRGHRKCLCTCVVVDTGADGSRENAQPCLTLRWPDSIQALQRRVYHRIPVPPSMKMKVLIWPGTLSGKPANPGQDRTNVYADMVDISVGGMAAHTSGQEGCLFYENQTVSCEFHTPLGKRVSLEAHFKHANRKPSGDLLLGFQFVGLEHGVQGRQRIRQLTDLVHFLSHQGRPPFRRGLSRRGERV